MPDQVPNFCCSAELLFLMSHLSMFALKFLILSTEHNIYFQAFVSKKETITKKLPLTKAVSKKTSKKAEVKTTATVAPKPVVVSQHVEDVKPEVIEQDSLELVLSCSEPSSQSSSQSSSQR